MKKLFFLCTFLVMASLSFGQLACNLTVTNTTSVDIRIGVQYTNDTPNECSPTMTGSSEFIVPAGSTSTLLLGTVPVGAPAIRPFRVGAVLWPSMAMASWQINPCWGPLCMPGVPPLSDGPLNIDFTFCGDYETQVTVSL